jgi:regulator of replication initiation timing
VASQEGLRSFELVSYTTYRRIADDVNQLGDDIETMKRNTQTLIEANKEAGLEVNTEKTKYMLLSRHQNGG